MSVNTGPIVYDSIGAKDPIMLNRYGSDNISIEATLSATATYTIEATTARINRGETPNWKPLPSATGLTANLLDSIKEGNVEAIRFNISALTGTLTAQVMQSPRLG